MCEENQLKNVTLVQAAVGDQEGDVQISDSNGHEANSIIGVGSGISVRGTTLNSISQSLGLSQIDFLKMNIEGAERLALPGLGEMAQKTRNVCIACHDFLADDGGPDELRTRAEVIRFLKDKGFTVFLRESGFFQNFVYGQNEKLFTNGKVNSG